MADIIPYFVGGCVLCFLTGYGLGLTFNAVRQFIKRATRT